MLDEIGREDWIGRALMGRARELSMGPRKPRSRVGNEGDFARLRRLTAAENPDVEQFKEVLDRVSAQTTRFRQAEGMVFNRACARYTELTGEQYGSPTGMY